MIRSISIALALITLVAAPPVYAATPGERTASEASVLIDRGAFAAAKVKASLAQTLSGGKAPGLAQLARIEIRQGNLTAALSLLDQAVSANAKDVLSQYLRVQVMASLGRADAALSSIERAASAAPDDMSLRLVLASAQVAARRIQVAKRSVTAVLKKAETSLPAMVMLTRAYLAEDNLAGAKAIIERAMTLGKSPDALHLRAQIALAEDELVRARAWLEEVVALDAGNIDALNNLAVVYLQVKDAAGALGMLKKVVMLAPGFASGWLNLGTAQRGTGNFAEAEVSWKRVLKLNPKAFDAWFNLGVLYLENPMPGHQREAQLSASILAFNAYKKGMRTKAGTDVDAYIAEARILRTQEQERKAEELKSPDEGDGMDDGGGE